MIKKQLILFILSFCPVVATNAQQAFDFNIFNEKGELRTVYVQRYQINDRYTLTMDGGAYLGLGKNRWTRWGFRGNMQRHLSHKYSLNVGLMYNYVKYPDFSRQEFRPHQAFDISYPQFKSSALKHRFRLEERIFKLIREDVHDFKVRLRYRVLHQGRFDGKAIMPHSFYYRGFAEFNFNIYNEAKDVLLVRGRYCAGCGYRFSSKLSLDADCLLEHTQAAANGDQTITHIIQITLKQNLYRQN